MTTHRHTAPGCSHDCPRPSAQAGHAKHDTKCHTDGMKRHLPEAVKGRTPIEKLVWLYVDRYPGEHSVRSLVDALGVYADRALPALVRDGLLIEEEAPAGSKLGKYRAAELAGNPKPARASKRTATKENP